jgi:hypothetical protein
MALNVGELVEGKYRVVRMIGEGGMGAVYEGENLRINRRVAIKTLHSAYTQNKDVIQRFEREAQAAGRIGNDHIIEVLDLGTLADGDTFMVMEFLDGEPLGGRIQRMGRLTAPQAAPLVHQILIGLGAAHNAGIIHRDLKPDNIFILKEKAGRQDFVKLIDFGISKFQPLSGDGMKMTRTGAVMGTPYYMSPEQASGSTEVDHRSDIYSVGVILYEAVTGRVPFEAATFNQLMFKIVLSEVPPVQSIVPDLDPGFATLIGKAMARDINARFQTCGEFRQAVEAWMQTGLAVAVPPDMGGSAYLPDGSRASMVGVPGLAGITGAHMALGQSNAGATGSMAQSTTGAGTWAASQPGVQKKSAAPLLAAIAGMAVVLGGGGFAAYALLGGKGEASPATDPSAASAQAPVSAPSAPPEPVATAKVEPPPATTASAAPSTPPSASAAPEASAAPAVPAAPRPAVARPSAPKPAAPKPDAKKPAKPAGGIDFGY